MNLGIAISQLGRAIRQFLLQHARPAMVAGIVYATCVFSTCAQGQSMPEELPRPDPNAEPVGYFNLKFSTLGGKQFWTDLTIRRGWRIQQNVYSGHFRLIDEKDTRWAWGNYAHCYQKLEERLPLDSIQGGRDIVILLHGLGRSRSSMSQMAAALEDRTDLTPVNFSYASTRGTLDDHARALDHVIRHLPPCDRISFVGHSLGNLVVRRYLKEYETPEGVNWGRMVMLGPPNQGAQVARRLKNQVLFNLVWGKSGKQLAQTWDATREQLATPTFEFAVLAGGADQTLTNPLVEGDDDLVVSVAETRLAGAHDFRHIAAFHTFMMRDPEAIELALRFLTTGALTTASERQPITAENLEQASQ